MRIKLTGARDPKVRTRLGSRDPEEKFTFAMCAVALFILLAKIFWE
jgi:hypothetical protein